MSLVKIGAECAEIINHSRARSYISSIEVLIDNTGKEVVAVYMARPASLRLLNSIDNLGHYFTKLCIDKCQNFSDVQIVVIDSLMESNQRDEAMSWLVGLTLAKTFNCQGYPNQFTIALKASRIEKIMKPASDWIGTIFDYILEIKETKNPNDWVLTLSEFGLAPITNFYNPEILEQAWEENGEILVECTPLFAIRVELEKGVRQYGLAVKSLREDALKFAGKVVVSRISGNYDALTKEQFSEEYKRLGYQYHSDKERAWTLEMYHNGTVYLMKPIEEFDTDWLLPLKDVTAFDRDDVLGDKYVVL